MGCLFYCKILFANFARWYQRKLRDGYRRCFKTYTREYYIEYTERVYPLFIKCARGFILKRHLLLKCLLILSHIIYRIPDVHISICAAVGNRADSPYRNICDAEHLCQLDFIGDASCIFIP